MVNGAAHLQQTGQEAIMLWRQNDCMHVYMRISKRDQGKRNGRNKTGCFLNAMPILKVPKAVVASKESITCKTKGKQ